MKGSRILSLLIVLLLVGLSLNIFSTLGNGQDENSLGFTVEHANKVYDGESSMWNFLVTNRNLTADSTGKTVFFLKIYLNDKLLWNEYEATDYHTWQLHIGSTVTRNFTFPRWDGPAKYRIRIELYWYRDGMPNLIAKRTKVVQVVKLFVTDWTSSIQAVPRGTDTPSNLLISLVNGGNDDMFNVSINVIETGELEITPQSQNHGTVRTGEKMAIIFSVIAPATKNPAQTQNLKFRIMYNDFRGLSRIEEFPVTVEVTPNPLIQNLLNIISEVAIASAICGMTAFYVFARKSKKSRVYNKE